MTRYAGNNVAYGSGGLWHVWVDVTDDGPGPDATRNVHYTYGVNFNGGIAADLTAVNWADNWGGSSADGFYCGGAGDHTVSGPSTAAGPIQYGGGNSIHFHMAAGPLHYTGSGTSSVDFDYPMPARTGTPPPDIHPPSAPPTSASYITANSVKIHASAPTDSGGAEIDRFEVYLLSNNALPWGDGNIVKWWSEWTGDATGLTRNTAYFYTARAHNSAGWSAWTGIKAFWTLSSFPDTPAAPSISSITQGEARVSWSAPSNGGSAITAYTVQIATNYGFTTIVQTLTVGGSWRSWAITGLDPNTTYYARVRAVNAIGAGYFSAQTGFVTLSGTYLRVSGAWARVRPHGRVSGAWVDSETHGRVSGAWS